MRLCAIDFEATGLDTNVARITEFALTLIESEPWRPYAMVDNLVYESDYPDQSIEVALTTHITDEMLKKEGISFVQAIKQIICVFDIQGWPDYFVAHNKGYDQNLWKAELKRHKEELVKEIKLEDCEKLYEAQFICSVEDIPHPEKFKCKKLAHLCLDYGITVNPSSLHRASGDVALLVGLLERAVFDWDSIIAKMREPWVFVRACVPHPKKDNGAGKDKAAKLGFAWKERWGVKFDNTWFKRVKEADIANLQEQLGYPVVKLAT